MLLREPPVERGEPRPAQGRDPALVVEHAGLSNSPSSPTSRVVRASSGVARRRRSRAVARPRTPGARGRTRVRRAARGQLRPPAQRRHLGIANGEVPDARQAIVAGRHQPPAVGAEIGVEGDPPCGSSGPIGSPRSMSSSGRGRRRSTARRPSRLNVACQRSCSHSPVVGPLRAALGRARFEGGGGGLIITSRCPLPRPPRPPPGTTRGRATTRKTGRERRGYRLPRRRVPDSDGMVGVGEKHAAAVSAEGGGLDLCPLEHDG